MYYQNYEDYMRSVLGYPIEPNNTYMAYSRPYENPQIYNESTRNDSELLELYPEIYRIVNPMVCKICDANTKPITRELVDQMTDEIYMNLEVQPEVDTVVNVRANVPTSKTEVDNNRNNRKSSVTSNSNTTLSQNSSNRSISEKNKEIQETRESQREDRQRRPDNRTLRDLIKILILNQLIGGNFPNRPQRPPRPPMPPTRPPFPREDRFYENYLRY